MQNVFDDLEGYELRHARTRSNPYETIRGGIFLNRAAMKMANMDHVFDYMFTSPEVIFLYCINLYLILCGIRQY